MDNDEKKMIEEMADIIALVAFQQAHEINGDDDLANVVATALYNANYRKIDDDEVVITEKQYKQLKKYNLDRKRLRNKWQKAEQELKQAKQETREILQEIPHLGGTVNLISNGITISTDYTINRAKLVELAKKHGIELE